MSPHTKPLSSKARLLGWAVAVTAMLAGCGGPPTGRPVEASRARQLMPGSSTRADVVAVLGRPLYERVGLQRKDLKGKPIDPPQLTRVLHYRYAEPSSSGAVPWVVPAREVNVLMIDDQVVGYNVRSTFREDSTDLNMLKVSEIKAGQSTVADVELKLGPPPGRNVWPLTLVEGGQTWLYGADLDNRSTHVLTRKRVYVHFNARGVVEDLQIEHKDDDSVAAPPNRGGGGGSYTPVYVPPASTSSMRGR